MANQTISSSKNFDDSTISALANGEDLTINTNATLTINSDVRWAQNAAVIGALTIDSTTGGTCLIDGTSVWWLTCTSSGSTVPAIGTTITGSSSGATGELIGVFSALGVDPTTAGSAVPSPCYVKLRSKTGTFQSETLNGFTGGTVTSGGAGERGWIHVVGEEATTITVPRLGVFEVNGDWFTLGTSSGASAQTFQHYVADYVPAIWVETGSGTGTYEVWINSEARFAAGDVGGSLNAAGKYYNCGVDGIVTFGNGTTGAIPTSGAIIRVPNVHISNSNSTNWAANTLINTLTTRWEFATTSAGYIDIDKCLCNAYFNLSQAYYINLSYVGTSTAITISECASAMTMNEVGVGVSTAVDSVALTLTSNFAGATITNSVFGRYTGGSNSYVISGSYNNDFSFSGCTAIQLNGAATTASRACFYFITCSNLSLTNCNMVNGKATIVTVTGGTFTNTAVCDRPGASRTTGGYDIFGITAYSNNITIDGLSKIGSEAFPYNLDIVDMGQTLNAKIRNIGSVTSYLDGASVLGTGINLGTGNNYNIKVQRCYINNLRASTTALIGTLNSNNKITFENIGSTTESVTSIQNLNTIIKGARFASSNMGAAFTSVYGTHFYDYFTSDTVGRLGIIFTEKTTVSPSSTSYEITAGAPKFTSTGSLTFVSGDTIEYTWPHYILGYTAFTNTDPTKSGTTTTNIGVQYKLDTGSGFSATWTDATGANLSAETISASTGFKLKLKFAATGSGALTGYYIPMTTTASDQQSNLYVLDSTDVNVVLQNVVSGSRYRIERTSDSLMLFEGTAASSTVTLSYTHTANVDVTIRVRNSSSSTKYVPYETQGTITNTGLTVYVSQVHDIIAASS